MSNIESFSGVDWGLVPLDSDGTCFEKFNRVHTHHRTSTPNCLAVVSAATDGDEHDIGFWSYKRG